MKAIARAFAMDEATWDRHANPWSAWTRVPVLPLLCLAIWARVWIGWWCLLPIGALVAWTWANPRAFPPPAHTRAWASRAVMGERVWLAREQVPIPRHHALWAWLLTAVSAAGMPFLLWGLWALEIWPLLLGLLLVIGGKLWFLDRMVWLFDGMAETAPDYGRWRRGTP
ncbi:MAG: DUF6653 family protein [Pseudomonadota bacterium]